MKLLEIRGDARDGDANEVGYCTGSMPVSAINTALYWSSVLQQGQ